MTAPRFGEISPIFSPSLPFPLGRKTLYGAARFALGEVQYMNNIKGLSQG